MGANTRRRHCAVKAGEFRAIRDAAFMRMARSACSQCGSADLEWSTVGTVTSTAPAAVLAYARELGPIVGVSASFWWCRACEEAGAFEQELHWE